MSRDSLEMRVCKPPTDRETALKVAEEQFLYCSDMETNGTLDDLAASLINASVWSFGWN